MKIYTKEINNCFDCPLDIDGYCLKLCLNVGDDRFTKIHPNCPLPDISPFKLDNTGDKNG